MVEQKRNEKGRRGGDRRTNKQASEEYQEKDRRISNRREGQRRK